MEGIPLYYQKQRGPKYHRERKFQVQVQCMIKISKKEYGMNKEYKMEVNYLKIRTYFIN